MRKFVLAIGLVVLANGATACPQALASGGDICKQAAHDEHLCQLGSAKCLTQGKPAECSQAMYDCYIAQALLDQCQSQESTKK